jgi:flagellar assembly protein FliH
MSAEFVPHSGFGQAKDLSEATPLKSSEIASFIKTMGNEGYRKDETAPRKAEAPFKPKSLLDLAREASERLRQEGAAAVAETAAPNTAAPETSGPDAAAAEVEPAYGDDLPPPIADQDHEHNDDLPLEADASGAAHAPAQEGNSDAPEDIAHIDAGEEAQPEMPADPAGPGPAAAEQQTDDQALQDAYERGLAEGQAQARSEVEAMMAHALHLIETAAGAFSAQIDTAVEPLARSIEASVISLATARAGSQIDTLPKAFLRRIETLAERVQASVAAPVVQLHPMDLAVLRPMLEQSDKLLSLRLVANDRLQRGDIDMKLEGIRLTDMLPHVETPAQLVEYVPLVLAPDAMPQNIDDGVGDAIDPAGPGEDMGESTGDPLGHTDQDGSQE